MRGRLLDRGHAGVGAGEPDGHAAGAIDGGDEARVDRAGQNGDDDVEGRRIGHAQPVHLALGDARGRERGIDFLAAAVDYDQRSRGPRNRAGDRGNFLFVLEELAAELEQSSNCVGPHPHARRTRGVNRSCV